MRMPKIWLCMTLAAALWSRVTPAAPSDSPEPQRSFASTEDAVNAFVTALRNHQEDRPARYSRAEGGPCP